MKDEVGMSLGLIRDTLASAGYQSCGDPIVVGEVRLRAEAFTGIGSKSSLVVLWEGSQGYREALRIIMALRALLARDELRRPLALVIVDRDESLVPSALTRAVRTVFVRHESGAEEVEEALQSLLPLQLPAGALTLVDAVDTLRARHLTEGETQMLDDLIAAARFSPEAVTERLVQLVATEVRNANHVGGERA